MVDLPTALGGLLVVLSVFTALYGWLHTTRKPGESVAPLAIFLILLWFGMYTLGVAIPLSIEDLHSLLGLIITVTGVAIALIAGFATREYADAKSQARVLTEQLRQKQKKLNLFKEMCLWSRRSHRVWDRVAHRDAENRSDIHHGVFRLHESISALSKGVTHKYNQRPKAKKLLTASELADVKHHIDQIWYFTGGDSSSRYVRDFLEKQPGVTGSHDQLHITADVFERDLSNEFFGEPTKGFPTFSDWHESSGNISLLCDDMLAVHKKIRDLSLYSPIVDGKMIGSLMSSGILFPLVLTSFQYRIPSELVKLGIYFNVAFFLGVILRLGKELLEFLDRDLYKEFVEDDAPENSNRDLQ